MSFPVHDWQFWAVTAAALAAAAWLLRGVVPRRLRNPRGVARGRRDATLTVAGRPVADARRAKPRRRSVLRTVLLAAGGTYVAGMALLWLVQHRLIFPAWVTAEPWVDERDAAARVFAAERWWLDTPDGHRVPAWFLRSPFADDAEPAPAVVFFHGNGEIIDEHLDSDKVNIYLGRGVNLLIPEYRGYGLATGSPGQRSITGDMAAFIDRLAGTPGVDPERIILHGRSIGGGVAGSVARERPPRAMVLESTFTSVRAMAGRYLAPGFLVRHPFDTIGTLRDAAWPVLIMHGTTDGIIPHQHGRRLAQAVRDAGGEVTHLEWPAGHNDFPGLNAEGRTRYREAINGFLDGLGIGRPCERDPDRCREIMERLPRRAPEAVSDDTPPDRGGTG